MARKLSLPLFDGKWPSTTASDKPTVDVMRQRLGGRASTERGAGDLVQLTVAGGVELCGVVLFVKGDDMDVWVDNHHSTTLGIPASRTGVVRRTHRSRVAPLAITPSKALNVIAADARVFSTLHEGQRIRFQSDEGLQDGVLIEKCRFGALIQRHDGTIVGVGFRRIWPAQGQKA